MKRLSLLLTAIALLHGADDPVANHQATTTWMILRPAAIEISVDAQGPLASPLPIAQSNFMIKYLPSGKSVPQAWVQAAGDGLVPGSAGLFAVIVNRVADALPAPGDRTYEIQITSVGLAAPGSSPITLKATGTIYDASNIQTLVDATAKALSTAKTTEEKDLFAGFNIAIPSSGSSAVQGDFVFNRTVRSLPRQFQGGIADSGAFGLKLKKGSEDGKDPRHLDLGFSLRKTILLAGRADITTLRTAVSPGASPVPNTAALAALNRVNGKFWRAVLADYGFQMEGDVSEKGIGHVSNAIFDLKPQLATAAKSALGDQVFFALRFMPMGWELGKNLTNPDNQTKEIGNVVRYKAAGELRFFYQAKAKGQFLDRVELNGSSVYRRLFTRESAYDSKTKKAVNTIEGDKLWTQIDLKVFSGLYLGKIRPGLKVTYQRGYLPPIYAQTKVFTYGLVFESSDGGN